MTITRGILLSASAFLVAVTAGLWMRAAIERSRPDADAGKSPHKGSFESWNKPLTEGRCAIAIARFGGGRARLVRVETGGTVHFAIVESTPRNNPMNTLYQGDWLRANYGSAQTTTLGTFGSAQAALNRAAQLCPPARRCLPGRPGCDQSQAQPSPLELFALPPLPVAPPPSW